MIDWNKLSQQANAVAIHASRAGEGDIVDHYLRLRDWIDRRRGMPHPSGLTCLHRPDGVHGLCERCHREWEDDPLVYREFGDHQEGRARWDALCADLREACPEQCTDAPRQGEDEIPF